MINNRYIALYFIYIKAKEFRILLFMYIYVKDFYMK